MFRIRGAWFKNINLKVNRVVSAVYGLGIIGLKATGSLTEEKVSPKRLDIKRPGFGFQLQICLAV